MFKIGDKIRTNPIYDEKFKNEKWWNNWKNKPMTIKNNIKGCIIVEENKLFWRYDWMTTYFKDFITEEEMKIN